MPTESDFLSAADLLVGAGASIDAVAGPVGVAFGSQVLTGGQLTAEIEELLATTRTSCTSDADDLDALAALCRERAAVVAAYADAVAVYGSRMQTYAWAADRWQRNYSDYLQDPDSYGDPGSPPALPLRPQAPAPWVEL
ncbi:MAG: hypothetical protein HKN03_06390 [Acidimicrobiales bacterium]|nr:hypothetical protein [Acidimicrobiales bacterium]